MRIFILSVVASLIVLIVALAMFFSPYEQIGSSMIPTLPDGEKVIVYDSQNLQRGDIVVFHPLFAPEEFYLKRIIGLPGETLILKGGRVFVNERALTEPYIPKGTLTCVVPHLTSCENDNKSYTVPDNSYFVLGDNRSRSSDSRAWYDAENKQIPFVERSSIVGKMILSIPSFTRVVDRPILESTQMEQALDVTSQNTPENPLVDELPSLSDTSVQEAPLVQEVSLQAETSPPAEMKKNWDHIAKSLTKYLISGGEKFAMVESCSAGYEKNYRGDYTCKDYDYENRWLEFEWLDGRVVRAPQDLSYHFLLDFQNPGGSSFQYRMTSDRNFMIYLDTWSDDEARVVSYDIANASKNTLMSFLPVKEDSCNGIRFFGWNPNETKLGIVVGNEGVYGSYPNITKVFILTVEDGELAKKSNYPLPVVADCTPNNGPFFAVDWVNDDTIGYYDPNDNPYGDHTKDDYDPEYLETFFWGDDRWGSEYVKYRDVD